MEFIKIYWSLMQPFRKRMAVVIFFILLFETVKQAAPLAFSKLLDFLNSTTTLDVTILLILLLAIFISRIVNVTLDNIWDRLVARVSADVQKYFRTQTFDRLLRLPLHEHLSKLSGTYISEVEKACNDLVWEITASSTWEFWPIILGLFTSSIMLCLVKWQLMIVFLLPVPVFVFFIYRMNVKTQPLKRARRDKEVAAGGMMGEALANIQVVRTFGTEEFEGRRFAKLHQSIRDSIILDWGTIEANYWLMLNVSMEMARLLFLIIAISFYISKDLTLGQLVLSTTVSDIAYSSLSRLSFFLRKVLAAMVGITDLQRIFKSQNALTDHPQAQGIISIEKGIRFDHVSFCYQGGAEALREVSLKIRTGQTVALIGKSGSGKTTLVSLLTRLFAPDQGKILIDNVDLQKLDRAAYLGLVGFVPQGGSLFSGTISENIGYGLSKPLSENRLIEIATAAHAYEFIQKMPLGFKTRIGERGIKLSGGQAQRLAIARALARNPQILIFDEATSHLDSESEKQIQNWILEQSQNLNSQLGSTTPLGNLRGFSIAPLRPKIMIIIAHRLSTVIHCDWVFVMDQGQIVEQGKHASLLSQNGLYARLYQQQFTD